MCMYIYMHHDDDVITWTNGWVYMAYTAPESAHIQPQGYMYMLTRELYMYDSGVVCICIRM